MITKHGEYITPDISYNIERRSGSFSIYVCTFLVENFIVFIIVYLTHFIAVRNKATGSHQIPYSFRQSLDKKVVQHSKF